MKHVVDESEAESNGLLNPFGYVGIVGEAETLYIQRQPVFARAPM